MKLIIIEDYKAKAKELSGKELTDYLVCRCLGRENAVIKRMEGGKPYIEDGPCFSVSHSGNLFACAVFGSAIGIDIQYRRDVDTSGISRRYFADEEIKKVETDENWFFKIWARKEAYAKYTGEGLPQIMRKEAVLSREDVEFRDFMIGDDCFCSVCITKGEKTDEIQISC